MRKNKKGFTLIEIIVVVVILAVLMAVAVPSVLKYINEADTAKYLALSRGVNEEVTTYVAKTMIENSGEDFGKTIAKLKLDLSYGQNNKLDSIITTDALDGEYIYSIDCEFDGKLSKKNDGWAYDETATTHSLTKISIWYNKIGDRVMTEDTKFVVTLINEKMYAYIDSSTIFGALGKKEGPIYGL